MHFFSNKHFILSMTSLLNSLLSKIWLFLQSMKINNSTSYKFFYLLGKKVLVQTAAPFTCPGLAWAVGGLHIWPRDIFTALFFVNAKGELFSLVSWVLQPTNPPSSGTSEIAVSQRLGMLKTPLPYPRPQRNKRYRDRPINHKKKENICVVLGAHWTSESGSCYGTRELSEPINVLSGLKLGMKWCHLTAPHLLSSSVSHSEALMAHRALYSLQIWGVCATATANSIISNCEGFWSLMRLCFKVKVTSGITIPQSSDMYDLFQTQKWQMTGFSCLSLPTDQFGHSSLKNL